MLSRTFPHPDLIRGFHARVAIILTAAALLFILGQTSNCFAYSGPVQQSRSNDCDLVIAEASTGGVAAAYQAARLGVKTCLTSMTDWVGGQISTQAVSAIDAPYHYREAGRQMLKAFGKKLPNGKWEVSPGPYRSGGIYSGRPHIDEVERSMKPLFDQIKTYDSNCWVSFQCFRPSDADQALKKLLAPYVQSGMLKIFYETVPNSVKLNRDGSIRSVTFLSRRSTHRGKAPYSLRLSKEISDWYSPHPSRRYKKRKLTLKAKIFIDATETGELIVLSHARHRLGSVPPETKENDPDCVMGFVFPMNLLNRKPTQDELAPLLATRLPPGGDPFNILFSGGSHFQFWNDFPPQDYYSVWDYREISASPNVSMMNWEPGNDFTTRNMITPLERLTRSDFKHWRGGIDIKALKQAESRALNFAGWLNLQPQVNFKNRGVTLLQNIKAPENFFGTGTGLSKFPYIRETRRMEGYKGFYIEPKDILISTPAFGSFPGPQFTNFYDSVGIGSYPIDTRACPSGKRISNDYGGQTAKQAQIPLRALVSSNVPNLLAGGKDLAVTQIVSASYRVQPTEWNVGFGAASAAEVAIRHDIDLHEMMEDGSLIKEAQQNVIDSNGRVLWFSDQLPPESAK